MPITMRHHDADGKVIRLDVETSTRSEGGCCGGAAPAAAGACCALDAALKQSGGTGCGCGASATHPRSGQCC